MQLEPNLDKIQEQWTEDITGVNEKVGLKDVAFEEPCPVCEMKMSDPIFEPFCSKQCHGIANF